MGWEKKTIDLFWLMISKSDNFEMCLNIWCTLLCTCVCPSLWFVPLSERQSDLHGRVEVGGRFEIGKQEKRSHAILHFSFSQRSTHSSCTALFFLCFHVSKALLGFSSRGAQKSEVADAPWPDGKQTKHLFKKRRKKKKIPPWGRQLRWHHQACERPWFIYSYLFSPVFLWCGLNIGAVL